MENKIGICTVCWSENIVKNGHSSNGKQQFHCKDCGAYRILESEKKFNEARKNEIMRATNEKVSLSGIARIFHVSINTILSWIKKRGRNYSV